MAEEGSRSQLLGLGAVEDQVSSLLKELKRENDRLRNENEKLRAEVQKHVYDLKVNGTKLVAGVKHVKSSSALETELASGLDGQKRSLIEKRGSSESMKVAENSGTDSKLQDHGSVELYDEAVNNRTREKRRCEVCEGSELGAIKGKDSLEHRNINGSCALRNKGGCSGVRASGHALSADAVRRYSRQLLVPSFGIAGQEKLLKTSVLVVGCGGLGSPIALYLAAAGVGCLGLVDHDIVEISNLHRQVIHRESSIGEAKVKSAASACVQLNSSVQVIEYGDGLNAANAVDIISKYDVVLDATDNLPTRYLLSDVCVVTAKPLVSGAALGVEGQLSVYNHNSGPCYRCLYPVPPPQVARQRCSDNGVIGVVPGIIGTFQALEALKLAAGVGETLSSRMLILDALSSRLHVVKLRGKSPGCVACGETPQIHLSNLHEFDYERFTQSPFSDEAPKRQYIISESDRISDKELKGHLESGYAHVLLDVRDSHEYAISSLPNSINIPFSSLKEMLQTLRVACDSCRFGTERKLGDDCQPEDPEPTSERLVVKESSGKATLSTSLPPIYVVCRRGNDSQKAVQLLRNEGFPTAVDVIGGLESWAKNVDREFPFY